MSSEPALLRAVIDNPDDDVVRLIYADWCEEHGLTARATLIRTQVEQARLCVSPPPTQFHTSGGFLLQELLPEHQQTLLGPLLALDLVSNERGYRPAIQWELRRGFIEAVNITNFTTAWRFVSQAEKVFSLIPLQHFYSSVGFHRVDDTEPLSQSWLEILVELPCIAHLRTLDLGWRELPEELVLRLAESPYLSSLSRIRITVHERDTDGVSNLLKERFGDRVQVVPSEIPF